MGTQCKCHGVSGSCTVKTCWTRLPDFRKVGDFLMTKYLKSRSVDSFRGGHARKPIFLTLKKHKHLKPRKRELVHLHKSPNYCEYDPLTGSLGTVGRHCNRTSKLTDGCDLMCCGRGYNTHQFTKVWQCKCKFHWCCRVTCEECRVETEEYTCK